MKELRGTGVALVTPFNENGDIDFNSLEKLVNHVIKGSVEYLVVMGTTAESPVLSKDEKFAIFEAVRKYSSNKVPLVYGIGGNCTHNVADEITKFPYVKDITAILSVAPYYNKPNQEGYFEHYKHLNRLTKKPIILYNVPGRTGSNVSWETQVRIAKECKKIVATKEASGNMEQIMRIIHHAPKGFMVLSGDDNLTLPIISCGGQGVISVVANAYPKEFSSMVRFALNGDFASARPLHYKLMEITNLLFADGNPGGIKTLLGYKKICKPKLRLPLMPPNEIVRNKIKEIMF
ncbi:MAG: 4-hydroxy-tetrahydrodipicolinate synthase [Bacteroidia bacterium]|nr:4-hydroxy-tetrahydrodipicolinate synthase [Bacteroidia bacterium]